LVSQEELEYYATPGEMTELGEVEVPSDVPSLCEVVQGVLIHPFLTHLYGLEFPAHREDELQIRPAAEIVARLDDAPLTHARPPEHRVLGNCRDFSTVTTAFLRSKGVPARARCGFGTYFVPGKYIDHWVVEWWNGERWVLTDAQIDGVQRENNEWIDFDPLDVPRDRFIVGGDAWKLYRDGDAKPDQFGVLDMFDIGFATGNLVKDIASLNKVELLPWESWDADEDEALLDELAPISSSADFERARAVYQSDPRMRVPDEVTSYNPQPPHKVRVR
jgi:hypothetical protein